MAACSEITDANMYEAIPAEQRDEITALEAIFQEDFRIMEDNGGRDLGKISFDLAVKVHFPFEGEVNIEAFIPVEAEEIRRLSSSSDSDETQEDGGCEVPSHAGPAPDEVPKAGATAVAVDEARADSRDHNIEPHNPVDDGFAATSRKPRFIRSLSLQHWHVQAGVQYLTPVHLKCTLPDAYPERQPPDFSISCLWLRQHQIKQLCAKLLALWDEVPNEPVVFTWADWLQNNIFEHLQLGPHFLLRENVDECPEVAGSTADPVNLQTALLAIFENDLAMRRDAFMQSRHLCEICFDEKDAVEFVYFEECRHFFCTECLMAHCQMHVDSGSVLQLLCPTPKCEVVIPPDVLQRILDNERYQRWERLMLSKTLDNMGDVVYCPRCNVPVVADEDESTKLAQCATCFYAFCTDCQSQWHQGTPCWPDEELDTKKSSKKKQRKKKNADYDNDYSDEEGDDGKQKEKNASRKAAKMTMNSLMFIRTMKKLGKYKPCPKCKMLVERVSGCDMMHCSQCRTMFCWSCGMKIDGYSHFGGCRGQRLAPAEREPTVGEQMVEQFKRENPKKQIRLKKCPRCHQKNIKDANNNHITCWACKTDFCYQCCKAIQGAVMLHFAASTPCSQHSED